MRAGMGKSLLFKDGSKPNLNYIIVMIWTWKYLYNLSITIDEMLNISWTCQKTVYDSVNINVTFSAVCEKCGAIGVKHAFYGKERKYCSLACARPPIHPNITNIKQSSSQDAGGTQVNDTDQENVDFEEVIL